MRSPAISRLDILRNHGALAWKRGRGGRVKEGGERRGEDGDGEV